MEESPLTYYLSKLLSEFKHQIADEVLLRLDDSKPFGKSTPRDKELLTPKELWTALKISESHFYKIKRDHKSFPVYDIGGKKRYKLSEVTDFFKNKVK